MFLPHRIVLNTIQDKPATIHNHHLVLFWFSFHSEVKLPFEKRWTVRNVSLGRRRHG